MITTDGFVDLGDGLSMLVVNDLSKLSRKLRQRAEVLVQQGEELQRTVFKEQNVSFLEERVLSAVAAFCYGQPTEPTKNYLYHQHT